MNVPAGIQQKHNLVSPYISQVSLRVRDIVRDYCDRHGYAYSGREKKSESLAEKIETGRYNSWSDIDDLFACSIIIPTLSCETDVLEFLRLAFSEVECKIRASSKKDPSVFRFDATRFVGRLRADSLPPGSENIVGVRFEVQIRTAFEHAWSVTTHALSYKGPGVDWKRIRLSSQLRAAVEQLDLVVSAFEQTASLITEQAWPEIGAKQKLQSLFEEELAEGNLPSEVVPASWGRFLDNLYKVITAGRPVRTNNIDALIGDAIDALRSEIRSMSARAFPRSVSLLQFCIGALVTRTVISPTLNNYVPFITRELTDIFPDSKRIKNGFDLELSAE